MHKRNETENGKCYKLSTDQSSSIYKYICSNNLKETKHDTENKYTWKDIENILY